MDKHELNIDFPELENCQYIEEEYDPTRGPRFQKLCDEITSLASDTATHSCDLERVKPLTEDVNIEDSFDFVSESSLSCEDISIVVTVTEDATDKYLDAVTDAGVADDIEWNMSIYPGDRVEYWGEMISLPDDVEVDPEYSKADESGTGSDYWDAYWMDPEADGHAHLTDEEAQAYFGVDDATFEAIKQKVMQLFIREYNGCMERYVDNSDHWPSSY